MNKLRLCITVAVVVALVGAAGALWKLHAHRSMVIGEFASTGRLPRIRPEYAGCVIPPNIAPLNFVVAEPGTHYYVRIHSAEGRNIEIPSRTPRIVIPIRQWRELLNRNRGSKLFFDIFVKNQDDPWRLFDSITNTISKFEIDGYLAYRRIPLVFNYYSTLSICQRNLENYDETVVLNNKSFDQGCMNCHSYLSNNTDKMAIQTRRGQKDCGNAMILCQKGVVTKVDTRTEFAPAPAAFTSWHPSGRLLAFSVNKVGQVFHTTRKEVRDFLDLKSDIALYMLDSKTVTSTRDISRPDRLETYPAWSPDGRYLYFCSAPLLWPDSVKLLPPRFNEVRYDLARIGYTIETGTWGHLETLLSADKTGLSISEPKVSPDGNRVVFVMSGYGCFPTLQEDSDLYFVDVKTGSYRRLGCNSDQAESWPCWSSNGRWIVFTSKRPEGVFGRIYLAHIDENGRAHKPFLLPQRDPTFYDSLIRTYQLPELTRAPIPVRGEKLARVIRPPLKGGPKMPVTSASPTAGGSTP